MAAEPQTSSDLRSIRRMLRVLGALPAHVSDPVSISNAAKLVHDRLRRAGAEPIWYEPAGASPLVIAGTGPILVASYIDDIDPGAIEHEGLPPVFADGVVSAPGILRKAGVIAATAGATHPDNGPDATTLVIETNRYRGSNTLETWLSNANRQFDAAIWEATDLPVPAPAVIHSAFGRLQVRISATGRHDHVPAMYGGVVSDIGASLATALAELVGPDHEVRLDGFYDTVQVPDADGLAALADMAEEIKSGVERIAPESTALSTQHLAMGVFFAPSLVVREFHTENADPYLPGRAEAVVDIQILPGQAVDRVLESLRKHFRDRLQQPEITQLLVRAAVMGQFDIDALRAEFARVIPTGPGPNPAGLLASFGIPAVGYAAVGTGGPLGASQVDLQAIQSGAMLVRELIDYVRASTPTAAQ